MRSFALLSALFGALLSTTTSLPGVAQDDSTRVLQEIPIHANRIQTGVNETSANVLVIDSETLQRSPSQSIPDALHYFAGIDIRQRGANGVQADAGIRGSTFNQVLILINGIKISDPQTGHHSLNLPIDMSNVDRIEVVKGPAARIYGQNAFAGAINIITRNPEDTFVKLQAVAGEHGLGGFRVGASVKDKGVSHYLSASRDFSDGYQYNTDYVISNYFYQSGWNTSMGKWDLLAGLTDRSFGANGFYASPENRDQYESVQTSLLALSLHSTPHKNYSLNHRLYWRRNEDEYLFIRNNPPAYRNLHVNSTLGYEVNASIPTQIGTAGVGLDVNHLWLTSNNLGPHERTVATVFAEHRFELLGNRLDITPGLQLNYYSDFGTNVFPGVDAGYVLTPHVRAYANWGYTYRVPTYTDLYYSDPVNVGNPDLKPEYAISYEAGVKLVDTPLLSGQAGYFVRNGKRIIDWTKENATDPWRPDNLIGVDTKGWETQFTIRPAAEKSIFKQLDVSYTYIDADKTGEAGFSRYALENLRHQVVASVSLRYGSRFTHSIYYRYVYRVNLPDYTVIDTRLAWQSKAFGWFLDVTNLLDQPYKETNLVTLPGRWIKSGVSYTFMKR